MPIVAALGGVALPALIHLFFNYNTATQSAIGVPMALCVAFAGNGAVIDSSKMAILVASFVAGVAGFVWLKSFGEPLATDEDLDATDFETSENEN